MSIEVKSPRPLGQALMNGLRQRCPSCGVGRVFYKYIKVNHTCEGCGLELHHQRADDAPPYFTIVIVGHVIISGLVMMERMYHPAMWVHLVVWLPLSLAFSLWLLPRVKGALIGLQWARQMHGFGGDFT